MVDGPISRVLEHITKNTLILTSEVSLLETQYRFMIQRERLQQEKMLIDKTLVDTGVAENVATHPFIISAFENLVQEKISPQGHNMSEAWQISRNILAEIRTFEEVIQQGSLEECDKTAWIMPDYISRDIYRILVTEKNMPHAFLGEETFSDVDRMFCFDGVVPPYLIQRIHKIGESGIWKWWKDLFQGKDLTNKNTDRVEAANMKGNIVIIFVVWVGGILFSLLCTPCEFVRFRITCRRY